MSNHKSESAKNEPVFRSDVPKMDTSARYASEEKLQQEACKQLSSPPINDSFTNRCIDSTYIDHSAKEIILHGHAPQNVNLDHDQFKMERSVNGVMIKPQTPENDTTLTQTVRDKNGKIIQSEIHEPL